MDLNELLRLEQIALLNADHSVQQAERTMHADLAAYYARRIRALRETSRVSQYA